jgi:hypothetical protein
MPKRLRLVSMTLIPHFVVDDGENLSPLEEHLRTEDGAPLSLRGEVTAAQWPTFATGKFLDDVADIEQRLNVDTEPLTYDVEALHAHAEKQQCSLEDAERYFERLGYVPAE